LKALGQPFIYFGKKAYFNLFSYEYTINAIMRPGQPDFYSTGSNKLKNHFKRKTREGSKPFRTRLSEEDLRQFRDEAGDIIARMELASMLYTTATRRMIEKRAMMLADILTGNKVRKRGMKRG
jgi:hypothetical protein